jgi:hypothetical protein
VCVNNRALKQLFSTKPERVRSVGRPKLRLEDGVNQVMKPGRVPPWTETNGHSFSRRPRPTKGSRASVVDDDDDVLI